MVHKPASHSCIARRDCLQQWLFCGALRTGRRLYQHALCAAPLCRRTSMPSAPTMPRLGPHLLLPFWPAAPPASLLHTAHCSDVTGLLLIWIERRGSTPALTPLRTLTGPSGEERGHAESCKARPAAHPRYQASFATQVCNRLERCPGLDWLPVLSHSGRLGQGSRRQLDTSASWRSHKHWWWRRQPRRRHYTTSHQAPFNHLQRRHLIGEGRPTATAPQQTNPNDV